ncbi:VanW family protein [Clostridiaceae bacterium UIB06]|uniref:VanW family protein n=1 Tax=Clostridium thailandense TaxID=2794346 RepID=A0A949TVD1_9CLOT|nr:VanW family protein [Clostridium thailandense]MBV7272140.1 VanW family protein [Clostridium thailandense]MCH5136008.1 VanW family protein [Clostridiaceae bacterium UIB06]
MIRKKRNMKKITKLGVLIGVVVLVGGIIGFAIHQNSTVKAWSDLIYPGVKVSGEDLSGKSKEQAKQILEKKYVDGIAKKKINIVASDRTYTLDYSKLNPKYNIDEAVNQAFSYGKNSNALEKYKLIKWPKEKEVSLGFTYDQKVVNELISSVEQGVNKAPVDATIKVSEGNITVVPDQGGKKLEKDKLQKEVLSKIDGGVKADTDIKAPVETVAAKITSNKISSINAKIGSFSTEYGAISSSERANNIQLATNSINGKILMPGDSFSFNDVVGERTAKKGYQAAPVIIGNQVDSGLGGGICQVSTTLYNAVLRSNIKSVEREHHTLPSHYVKVGLDATVDYGNLDYKFKNTLDYPIYIEGDTSGGVVAFNIYSNSSLSDVITDIKSEIYQVMEANTRYIDDPTLPVGQTEQVQAPSTGYKVRVRKITRKGSTVISNEIITNDSYEAIEGIIKRGTKKEETTPPTPNNTNASTNANTNASTPATTNTSTSPNKNTNTNKNNKGQ